MPLGPLNPVDVLELVLVALALLGFNLDIPRKLTSRRHALASLSKRSAMFRSFYSEIMAGTIPPGVGVARWYVYSLTIALWLTFPQLLAYSPPAHLEWITPALALVMVAGLLGQHALYESLIPKPWTDQVPMLPPWSKAARPRKVTLRVYREFAGVSRVTEISASLLILLALNYEVVAPGTLAGVRGVAIAILALSALVLAYTSAREYLVAPVLEDALFKEAVHERDILVHIEVHPEPAIPDLAASTGVLVGIGDFLTVRRADDAVVDFDWPQISRTVVLPDDTP